MARTQHQHQQAPAAPQQAQVADVSAGAVSGAAMRVSRHARRGAGASKGQATPPVSTGTLPAGLRQAEVKESRTKVVVRHLPPTMGAGSFTEELEARFGGMYTWTAFRAGKASHKRQVQGVAYLNFRRPEDVLRFYDEFDGHVFVNEKGAQYKAMVEYAPYQRVPKPRSKKDVREGTIFKDPDYLQFAESLGKPQEFLPSAEVQLERREAEKAAAGINGMKEAVVVTPLMEFVRQRRAAKAAPQRSMSMSAKLASRLGSGGMKISMRGEKSGLVPELESAASRGGAYEGSHGGGSRREDQQRRDRDVDRRRKETVEGKEKKLVREAVAAALSSTRASPRGDSSAEHHGKDGQEGYTDTSSADVEPGSRGLSPGSGPGGAFNYRSRPPQSPKHGSLQGGPGGASSASKPSHGKEAGARGSRGPRTDKQDASRVRNKDRPDRPVWTPRRRADSSPGSDSAPSSLVPVSAALPSTSQTALASSQPVISSAVSGSVAQPGAEVALKPDKNNRSQQHRSGGKSSSGQVFVTVDRSVDSSAADSVGNQGGLGLESASPSSRRHRPSESAGPRSSRAGRAVTNSGVENISACELDGKNDARTCASDMKGVSVENGEALSFPTVISSALRDRRKQDSSSCWSDMAVAPKQVGRRDRNSHQIAKDTDGFLGPDANKSTKRGGAISLGGSEKQVWVAVQKSGTGT